MGWVMSADAGYAGYQIIKLKSTLETSMKVDIEELKKEKKLISRNDWISLIDTLNGLKRRQTKYGQSNIKIS